MDHEDPPPTPQSKPSTEHTPDRLFLVIGNATLLGIGYMLMRRPRLAIASLIGSLILLALIAFYPYVLVWRLLLPVWWAAVESIPGARRPGRTRYFAVWRTRCGANASSPPPA